MAQQLAYYGHQPLNTPHRDSFLFDIIIYMIGCLVTNYDCQVSKHTELLSGSGNEKTHHPLQLNSF